MIVDKIKRFLGITASSRISEAEKTRIADDTRRLSAYALNLQQELQDEVRMLQEIRAMQQKDTPDWT